MPTTSTSNPLVVRAGPEHSAGLIQLFKTCGSACHCRWWHFTGDKNAWLERCAHYPELNRQELQQALLKVAPQAAPTDVSVLGVVALLAQTSSAAENTLVGWMKVAPWAAMQKLADQRPYRNLPCFSERRSNTYVIGCALVAPEARRCGVSRALLVGAEALARSRGAEYLEAFPRHAPDLGAEELWMGPAEIFLDAGFEEVARIGPYPVLRKVLALDRA